MTFVEPRSPRAMSAVAHLPGVMDVEPIRSVPVRLRAGHRSRTLAITGLPETPRLNRIVSRSGRVMSLPADGLVLSTMLGRHPRRLAGRPAAGRGARGHAVRAAGPGRRRSSTTASGSRPTCGSTRFSAMLREGGVDHRRRRDARPGRDRPFLRGREGAAGGRRRGPDARSRSRTSARRWRRT